MVLDILSCMAYGLACFRASMILSALLLEAMLSVVQLDPGTDILPSPGLVASAQPAQPGPSQRALKRGPKMIAKTGPKMASKWGAEGSPRASSWLSKWGPEKGLKLDATLGPANVIFCCYLQYFSKVGPSRKRSLLGPFLGSFLDLK